MAEFKKCEKNMTWASQGNWYTMTGELTEQDINSINKTNSNTIISIESTKGISSKMLSQITNPKVKISVRGGLDYFKKSKFDDREYIDRTMHDPQSLSVIVSQFEKIERGIRYTWNENQKCMYLYKSLVEAMHYKYDHESDYENGRDVVRSLDGIVYGKLVCSGFALAFKELLDRNNIENVYQNRAHSHSWNIVKIDGRYRPVDLTWDCNSKSGNNQCLFRYYCREGNEFYDNKHHDISGEREEVKLPLFSIDRDTLVSDLNAIKPELSQTKPLTKSRDGSFSYISMERHDGISEYIVSKNGVISRVFLDQELDPQIYLTSQNVQASTQDNEVYVGKKTLDKSKFRHKNFYTRNDGSNFFVMKEGEKAGVNEFFLVDIVTENNQPQLRRSIIISENNLDTITNPSAKSKVANSLLSKERFERKMEHYNGYVGYADGNGFYYNRDFEQNHLNIIERE